MATDSALEEVCGQLAEGEAIFAYLDDLYVVAAPERVRPVHNLLQDALWRHACVHLHAGKTRIWNAAGDEPAQVADLQPEDADPVWVGAWTFPPELQGMMVLGSPLGSDEYVQRQLQQKRSSMSCRCYPTSKPRDCCSCFAPPRARSTCCAPCHRSSRLRMPRRTMTLFGTPCRGCWGSLVPSPLSGQLIQLPRRWPSCLRAWEVWASCARPAKRQPLTGRRGLTRCRSCGSVAEAAARCARELSVGDEAAAPSLRAAALAGEALDGAGRADLTGRGPPTPRLMIRQSPVIFCFLPRAFFRQVARGPGARLLVTGPASPIAAYGRRLARGAQPSRRGHR